MCAFTTHAATHIGVAERVIFTAYSEPDLTAARSGLVRALKEASLHADLLVFRVNYEYELMVNDADRSLAQRRMPNRRMMSAFGILGNKGERFIGTPDHPVVFHPTCFADMFERGRAKRLGGEGPALYRLNCDAALCSLSLQSFGGVVQKLILQDWWRHPQPLTNGPRIIYIRVLLCWGVVFDWPCAIRCSSLLAAYETLCEECAARGITITAEGTDPLLPRETLTLFRCRDLE